MEVKPLKTIATMKTKNILMSVLLVMGVIAAKAAGYPPELALVSQPVMVYNHNSITVYYDVENIGDYTYRGDICIYLSPEYGHEYVEKYVKVRPGRIKRIEVEIPCRTIDRHVVYTLMPYYSMGRELYSFTTFEYFEPVRFCWHGPRTEPWVVIHIGPVVRYYHRPGSYRYYYDGFRPPMPVGPGMPPPMNPMHHTYGYHHNNGGYPATHEWNNKPEPKPNNNTPAPTATVRPKANGGSMSHGNSNSSATNNGGSSSSVKPSVPSGNGSSGRTGNSGNVSRPSSNSRPSGTTTNASPRTGKTNSGSRVNNTSSSSRPSATGSASSSGSSSRSSSGSSNSGRTGNGRR
jgi:hypothetical protein